MMPSLDTAAPRAAALVNGGKVDEDEALVGSKPVGLAAPTTVVASVDTTPAGAGTPAGGGMETAGAVGAGTSPTTDVSPPTGPIDVDVVKATCGTV